MERLTIESHRNLTTQLMEAAAAALRRDELWRRTPVHCTLAPLRVDYDWQSLQAGESRAWYIRPDHAAELLKDWQRGDYHFTLHGFEHGDEIQFEIQTFATVERPYRAKIVFEQDGRVLVDHINVLIKEPRIQVEIAELVEP